MANQIDLTGRQAIVTGAARGLGHAIAERLLRSGARVDLWDSDGRQLAKAAGPLEKIGPVHASVLDVTNADDVEGAAADARDHWGRIDILVNSAGILGRIADFADYPEDEWHRVIEVHLTGTFLCCRAVIAGMVEQDYGRIVNIASDAGKEGSPRMPAYSAAKAGVMGLTRAMGREFAKTGVCVNCITPTMVDTELGREVTRALKDYTLSRVPMGRFARAEEIAAMAAWLASEDCAFTTGAAFDATGGRSAF
jgi:3-oxoacyl-[acyl-carrier protein] reductase